MVISVNSAREDTVAKYSMKQPIEFKEPAWAKNLHESSSKSTPQEVTIGVWAALTVSLLSSFAGVYLEKMIKADQVSLPVRNVQLCLYSVPLQLLRIVSDREYDRVMPSGLCASSWVLAVNLAFAGLLVAYMMRYADNNLKNIAQALGTVLSSIAAIPLLGFEPDVQFVVGTTVVIGAALLYTSPQLVAPCIR